MPIMWRCSCGKLLKAKDEFAGRQAPCPACNAVHTVPNVEKPAQLQEEVFDAEAVEEPEPEEEIRDVLPVAEWEDETSAGYVVEPDASGEDSDSDHSPERDRPPPRRPRVSSRRRRSIVFDDSGDQPRHALRQDWFTDSYIMGGASTIFFAFVFFFWRMAFHQPGPYSFLVLAGGVLIGAIFIFKGVIDNIQR
jgi:hypothetical protein